MDGQLQRILRARLPIWLVLPMMVGVLAIGGVAGYYVTMQTTSPCPESQDVCASFQKFWIAWDLARDKYVDPKAAQPQELTDGAITGMINSLGDTNHSRYLSAEAASDFRESLDGNFEGIGAYIDVRDQQPIIVQPIEGSPAEAAGILPGDLILKVNDEDVRGVTVEELQSKVRGPKGTTVKLTVQHEGQQLPVEISVARDEIKLPSVTWSMLPNNVVLIKLSQFSKTTSADTHAALQKAVDQGATSIVLDLRNNPGGLVDELIKVAGEFLPPDSTVLIEQDRGGNQTPRKTSGTGLATTQPLAVLINNNTASAAEILAGALKEQNRATVIGVPTLGTATVLRPFDLGDGAQLWLGTSQWLTPNGEEVRNRGIAPSDGQQLDLAPQIAPLRPSEAAKLTEQELQTGTDTQLARALQVLGQTAAR